MRITEEDQRHMKAAIQQAELDQRIYKVGARIVKDGELLAEAHGLVEGGHHAEFTAIETCEKLGKDVRGATLYTTLEPCIHVRPQSNTDCAVKIVKSGIAEVVVGMLDPDDRVCSRGWSYLKQNGVRVRRFPVRLIKEIEDLSIDFIEAKATGVDARKALRSLTFAKSKEEQARPILGFASDLVPDLPDIRSLIRMYNERQLIIPRILWPPANDALWWNVLKQRQRILENVRTGTLGARSAELRNKDFEWVSTFIRDAWKIRTKAAARIPRMWRGMAPFWGWDLARAFEDALVSFLVICNTNVLLALARTEKIRSRALFPRARKWVEMVTVRNGKLSDVYQDVFSSSGPFYQVAVSRLGNWRPVPDRYIYVPRSEAMTMRETYGKHRIDHVSSSYTVPAVEYILIGEKTIVEYGAGEWRCILNDLGEDIEKSGLSN